MTDLLEIPHDFDPVLSRDPDVHVGVVADHVEPEGLQDGVTFMPGAGKVLEWVGAQNCRRILGAFGSEDCAGRSTPCGPRAGACNASVTREVFVLRQKPGRADVITCEVETTA